MTGKRPARDDRAIAREISYAQTARTRSGRAVIRAMENSTGRLALIRRARGYDDELRAGRDFWQVMVERYGLRPDIRGGGPGNIPAEGPVITVANHPYGILDGLMLGHILSRARGDFSRARGDFRILAHQVFRKAEDLDKVILRISFDETKEAVALHIETRRAALRYLAGGGAIGVFPAAPCRRRRGPSGGPWTPAGAALRRG